ncbi:MAG: hypothetical protein RIQ38_429 [Pseudomonadota bacterium]|jgi:3-isopropylmalate/(R)-2-methylmalate dehydratase small subunit
MNTALAMSRVWRFGSDIDTDVLAPGIYMKRPLEELATHCLEAVRPEFAAQVRPGDVLVAGPNFGIGSSREQAAGVLRHLGLAAVIAPSYSGLFFRNAYNLGLLLLTCPEAEQLQEGQRIGLQPPQGDQPYRVHTDDGRSLACAPVPSFLLDMVRAGGLLPALTEQFRKARS